MKRKLLAIVCVLALAASLVACGAGEETTLTGMVVSVDGTVISLVEMDAGNMSGTGFAEGERPEMPEGMEGFEGFDPGSFNPEEFDGSFPEGKDFPQRQQGEMPQMPEGMTPPQNGEMPEDGQMPSFGGGQGGRGFENFASDMETTTVDIGDAHISIENNGIKESGSIADIQPGTFVTITLNGKGEVTYVLITSQSRFGGGRGFGKQS